MDIEHIPIPFAMFVTSPAMPTLSLTSLSNEFDLADGFTVDVIPNIAPSKKPSAKALNKPPPSPGQHKLARRRSHEAISLHSR